MKNNELLSLIQKKTMKNKTSFSVKTLISQIFAPGLILAVLLSPSITFGYSIHVDAIPVSDVNVWSNGVILKGTTGIADYRWFEFGTSNSFSSFSVSTPKRGYDGGSNYTEKISGLSPNTIYFFRAVAEINGTRYYDGSMMRFKTKIPGYGEPSPVVSGNYSYTGGNSSYADSGNNNSSGYQSNTNTSNTGNNSSNIGYSYNYNTNGYNYNSYYSSSVVTKQADFLSFTSARLNANLFPSSEYNVYGWFEWGTTPNLGNTTSRVFIGKGPSLYFGQILSGLIPGTAYYFKPVIENVNGTRVEGTTLVFQTSGVSPYPSVATATDSDFITAGYTAGSSIGKTNSIKTTETTKTTPIGSPKTITIEDSSSEATVASGEKINKKIVFENTTGEDLTHVSIRIILPDGETFSSVENDVCKQIAGEVLFCDIGKMSVGQKIEVSYVIDVAKGLKNGISLEVITVAAGEYKDGRKVENFHRSESLIDSNKDNANLASAFFGASDSSIRDLFMSIEFILLLILSYFVGKHLSEKNKKEELNSIEALAYLRNQEAVVPKKQEESISNTPTEKGIPPTNLPV